MMVDGSASTAWTFMAGSTWVTVASQRVDAWVAIDGRLVVFHRTRQKQPDWFSMWAGLRPLIRSMRDL
jgi:hypothetical protein